MNNLTFLSLTTFLMCFIYIYIYLLRFLEVVDSIVNNRNILTDGTDERKYLRRKYSEM